LPLINNPALTVVPSGSTLPRAMYGPSGSGLVVVVPTAADQAAALQAGFSTNPDPAYDYAVSHDAQDVQFASFNYLSIARAFPKAVEANVQGWWAPEDRPEE
jgi:hypothetical protein